MRLTRGKPYFLRINRNYHKRLSATRFKEYRRLGLIIEIGPKLAKLAIGVRVFYHGKTISLGWDRERTSPSHLAATQYAK